MTSSLLGSVRAEASEDLSSRHKLSRVCASDASHASLQLRTLLRRQVPPPVVREGKLSLGSRGELRRLVEDKPAVRARTFDMTSYRSR